MPSNTILLWLLTVCDILVCVNCLQRKREIMLQQYCSINYTAYILLYLSLAQYFCGFIQPLATHNKDTSFTIYSYINGEYVERC